MAIFRRASREKRAAVPTAHRQRGEASGRGGDSAFSIIGAGTNIVGNVISEGMVRIEGTVHGTVRAARAVVLGRGGEVVGDIITPEAVIGGTVAGSVTAEERLELQSTGVVEGEICTRAQHLQINEGARFSGQIRMLDTPAEPMRALPAGTQAADESTELSTAESGAGTA